MQQAHLGNMAENPIRVTMIPWSAFGHLIPFFKLSIALAKAGVHVSFISTPTWVYGYPSISFLGNMY